MALQCLEDALQFLPRQAGIVLQRLEVAAEDGQRRAQLVRDIGDELLPHDLELLDARDVVKNHDRAAGVALRLLPNGHHADVEVARRLAQAGGLEHHLPLARFAMLDRFAQDDVNAGLAQRLEHGAAERALLELKKIEQFVVEQPHDVLRIDHHDALDHVGEEEVEVGYLLALRALQLLEPRGDGLEVTRHLLHLARAVDVKRGRPLAGGDLAGQAAHLLERMAIAVANVRPEGQELQDLHHDQKRDNQVGSMAIAMRAESTQNLRGNNKIKDALPRFASSTKPVLA